MAAPSTCTSFRIARRRSPGDTFQARGPPPPGGDARRALRDRRDLASLRDLHDETRGSDPVRTALACFACDGNLSRTASALCVHVNTLYQRMDRISRCSARGGATATTRCRSI
ncbi:helix-turn-helix domain-containing protein [Streptomyces sp. WC2508]|uniref:helix-turn-helix domain-containing protein n=1 Tax=Streptomyces sp. WC2508 TaxID=3461405 RepID=UPI0040442ABA